MQLEYLETYDIAEINVLSRKSLILKQPIYWLTKYLCMTAPRYKNSAENSRRVK